MDSLTAIVALNMLPKIGPVKGRALIDYFGAAEDIFTASKAQLERVHGIGPELVNILHNWDQYADPEKEVADATQRGIHILTFNDPLFPNSLRQIHSCPLLLYVWGEIKELDHHAMAIVGSRHTTRYGRDQAHKFAYMLAKHGFTIVSGLARGIDTHAHEGAIAAEGRTIAVIGSGLAQIYPPENMSLAERIATQHGAVVTEFPLHTMPDKQTFPQRNRIVAAWSRGLLVVECPERSGSLITANNAVDMGKHLFAIPGPIDRTSSNGCNQLIRNGATLVTDPLQIVEEISSLSFKSPKDKNAAKSEPVLDVTAEERLILDALNEDDYSIDEITTITELPVHEVSSLLLKLELDGHVQTLAGMRFSKNY